MSNEFSKCRAYIYIYCAVNHSWWISTGLLWLGSAQVTFGGRGWIMTTARPELPYPCSSHAKTRDESSQRGKYI